MTPIQVTIIVLLILAAVSINLVLGDNGIISRAKQAKEESEYNKVKEEIELAYTQTKQESDLNALGDKSFESYMVGLLKIKDENADVINSGGVLYIIYKNYKFELDMTSGEIELGEEGYGNVIQTYRDYVLYDTGIVGEIDSYDLNIQNVYPLNYINRAPFIANLDIEKLGFTLLGAYFCTKDNEVYTNNGYNDELTTLGGIRNLATDGYNTYIIANDEGKIFAKGKNNYGQLGAETEQNKYSSFINISELNDTIKDKKIEKIRVDWYATKTIAMDSEGNLYSAGQASSDLAQGNSGNILGFKLVNDRTEGLNGKKARDFDYNGGTLMVVADDGKLYMSGTRNDLLMDNSNELVCVSDNNEILSNKNFIKICASDYSNSRYCLLDSEGKVYIYGRSDIIEFNDYSNSSYGEIIRNKKIVDIIEGYDYFYAIDENSKGYFIPTSDRYESDMKAFAMDSDRFPDLKGKKIKQIVSDNNFDNNIFIQDTEGKMYVNAGGLGFAGVEGNMIIDKEIVGVSNLKKGLTSKKVAKIGQVFLDTDGYIIPYNYNENFEIDYSKQYKEVGKIYDIEYYDFAYTVNKDNKLEIIIDESNKLELENCKKVFDHYIFTNNNDVYEISINGDDERFLNRIDISNLGFENNEVVNMIGEYISDGNIILNLYNDELIFDRKNSFNKIQEILCYDNYRSMGLLKTVDNKYYMFAKVSDESYESISLEEYLKIMFNCEGEIVKVISDEDGLTYIEFKDGNSIMILLGTREA